MATQDQQKQQDNRQLRINKIDGFLKVYDNLCKNDLKNFIDEKNNSTLSFKTIEKNDSTLSFETLEKNIKEIKEQFSKEILQKDIADENSDLFRNLIKYENSIFLKYYQVINEFVKTDTILNNQCNNKNLCLENLIGKTIVEQKCSGTGGKKRRNKSRKTGKKRSRKHTKKQRR